MMRIVAALDAFKGSLDSRSAGEAVRSGVLRAIPDAEVFVHAVADGGEGTLDSLAHLAEKWIDVATFDALGSPRRARYLITRDGDAVLESALTLGLHSLGRIDATLPPRASSYGLGLQIADALATTPGRVLIGLGGTACTDGGIGLIRALGAEIRTGSPDGNPLWRFDALHGGLPDLSRVDALCDVTNPLLGQHGAARVFGPQKGATPLQVEHLEDRMAAWARSLTSVGRDVADRAGAGAAGGMGAALMACNANLLPGFQALADLSGLPGKLVGADLVVTGEGSLDHQTSMGKAPAGVAKLAHGAGAVVVALGGRVEGPASPIFDAAFPIHRSPRPLAEALDPRLTADELASTAAEVAGLLTTWSVHRGRLGRTATTTA